MSTTDPIITFVQFGVLGLVLLAILFGWLWARPAVEQLLEDKKRAEEQRDEAVSIAQERIVPLLTEFTSTTQALIPILQQLITAMQDPGRDDPRRRGR